MTRDIHISRHKSMTRRRVLFGAAAGGALFALQDLLGAQKLVNAQPAHTNENAPLLLICNFDGGWDQLLALDPRDATKFTAGTGIDAAYDAVAGSSNVVAQALANSGGSGLVTPSGSNITFGPAVGSLADHYADLCVVRGINMGTLTHAVGTRYFLTGKFPRGLAANGSSLGTWHAHTTGDLTPIPNLVVRAEAYNENLDSFATALSVRQSQDLLSVLAALGEPLDSVQAAAVDAAHWREKCSDQLYDQAGLITTWLDSWTKSKDLASGALAEHFLFTNNPSPTIAALYDAFSVDPQRLNADLSGPKGQALIAAQAFAQGISQTVSINLANGIDDHDDSWETDHAPALSDGFAALAALIQFLKDTPSGSGSLWDRVTLLVTSEFARTPERNGRGGRDHHLASSCIIAGPGIAGNRTIGATDNVDMALQPIDLNTGSVKPDGVTIRPPDVHATLLQSMGLHYDHIENQDPQIISAALK